MDICKDSHCPYILGTSSHVRLAPHKDQLYSATDNLETKLKPKAKIKGKFPLALMGVLASGSELCLGWEGNFLGKISDQFSRHFMRF